MSKRKQEIDSDDSGSDRSLVDVSFEFFDPNPNVDYHALKRLLAQLFQSDAEHFHLHELCELILSQPTVGTTVKTDGIESDPYAFLTVLNMHVHQNHPSIKALINYVLHKSSDNPGLHTTLQSLFAQSNSQVGFVFCERLINMPVPVIPPMYRMLNDELKWAVDDGEPYTFTHLLFISRTYHLSPDEEASMLQQPRSKRKKRVPKTNTNAVPPQNGIYSFHPEDEYIMQLASHTHHYPYSSQQQQQPRDKESFGLDTRGRIMLVPGEKLGELVRGLGERFGEMG